jgi:hypothetical protein
LKSVRILYLSALIAAFGQAQQLHKTGFSLNGDLSPGIAGNGIICLLQSDGVLYSASDEGLAMTPDYGQTWTRSLKKNGIGKGGISALDAQDGVIWIATGFDTLTDQGTLPAGGGVGHSEDKGQTWHWFPQPVDDRNENAYAPTTTHVQNITYDLAIAGETVWIASFAGGLRRSVDSGKTWEVVTVDGIPFNTVKYLTHRVFSVIFDGECIWVGTAGGIHKSVDGIAWTTFNHQNQDLPVSGNFVVAIGRQKTDERDIVWASTWPTTTESGDETEFKAVSKSEDGGLTWSVVLENESVHNFAFHEATVYAATDHGVFMSPDYGETWAVYPAVYDSTLNRTLYDLEINVVESDPSGVLWIGTSDGLGLTRDNGLNWTIFQSFVVPGVQTEPSCYACPNPFSPSRDRRLAEEGHCRFVYQSSRQAHVQVAIYDFGMNLVTTLDYEVRSPGLQSEPVWTGRNDLGDVVVNGVYFFRILVSGGDESWGKVMVVN